MEITKDITLQKYGKPIDITDWQTRRLNVHELGRVAGVSQRTVWRLVAAGRLPKPHKIGGNCTRWDGAEVAQALANLAAKCIASHEKELTDSQIRFEKMHDERNDIWEQYNASLNFIADIRTAAGDPEGKMMQDEFIEHVKELNHLAHKVKAATGLKNDFEALCRSQETLILRLKEKADVLQMAIEKTLSENGHLADGEVCTLIDLKRVMRGDFSPWVRIDYSNPSTHPELNRPCLIAWDAESAKGWNKGEPIIWERLASREKTDDCDDDGCTWMWVEHFSGEYEDFDPNPTHWRYAPQFGGEA